jgi:hypothetical protein
MKAVAGVTILNSVFLLMLSITSMSSLHEVVQVWTVFALILNVGVAIGTFLSITEVT